MKLLKDLDVADKRVFLRADLDVPIEPETIHNKLETETATRLGNLKGTVDYLVRECAKQIVIAGHVDRPTPRLRNGKPVIDPSKSTKLLLPVLQNILKREISFIPDVFASETKQSDGEIISSKTPRNDNVVVLLENLRFWEGETKNDPEFAKKLAGFADVYVNEAFGNSHREHASMVALPLLLPHCAGLHLEEEVRVMTKLLETPARPFVSIVGGAKIETKLPLINNLSKISHNVLVGGELPLEIAKKGQKFGENVLVATLTQDNKDISLESAQKFTRLISAARTVVWNGPMGLFEEGQETGSRAVALAILESKAYSVVGGGETTQFLEKGGFLSQFSFVSAGGGAMLEFLSGKKLPGIAALE
ncbi:MAG: phosphoglycerate kinase [Patescibacteria group bacterium]|mgnify:CR=1 FL=1